MLDYYVSLKANTNKGKVSFFVFKLNKYLLITFRNFVNLISKLLKAGLHFVFEQKICSIIQYFYLIKLVYDTLYLKFILL